MFVVIIVLRVVVMAIGICINTLYMLFRIWRNKMCMVVIVVGVAVIVL